MHRCGGGGGGDEGVRALPLDLLGNCGNTPLVFASMTNQVGVGRMLLRAGSTIDCENSYGTSALHRAIGNSADEFVMMLIQMRADVESRNFDGLTPLHLAGIHSAGSRAGRPGTALLPTHPAGPSSNPAVNVWTGVSVA